MSYNRELAIQYALKWALDRNSKYYNYDKIGGDCTNFISQCLYAGAKEMNYRQNGWYYHDSFSYHLVPWILSKIKYGTKCFGTTREFLYWTNR